MFSRSDPPAWALLPYGYSAFTRMRTAFDTAYNALTAWLPALAILILSGLDPLVAVLGFVAGYLAFISVYEIGYFANDTLDVHRSPASGGRERLHSPPSRAFVLCFVAVRIAGFLGIASLSGFWTSPLWIGGYVLLALAFSAHNSVAPKLRLLSFPVLAILRFLLPIIALLDGQTVVPALIVAALLYMLPRYLAYAESKGFIDKTVRARPGFRTVSLFVFALLAAVTGWVIGSAIPVLASAYYLIITAAGEIAGAKLRGKDARLSRR